MSTKTTRPHIDELKMVEMSEGIAEMFIRYGWQWAEHGQVRRMYTPNAALIALNIQRKVEDLTEPGHSISSGRITVAWEGDGMYPENDEITVRLELGSIGRNETARRGFVREEGL